MGKSIPHYTEDFKKNLVNLYRNGKTQSQLCSEFGVSQSALARWIKLFADESSADGEIFTMKQFREQQKRIARLEEENLILKKALAIFTPL